MGSHRGDIPALTPAEAGTRLSDPGGMQGGVDLMCAAQWRKEGFSDRERPPPRISWGPCAGSRKSNAMQQSK